MTQYLCKGYIEVVSSVYDGYDGSSTEFIDIPIFLTVFADTKKEAVKYCKKQFTKNKVTFLECKKVVI